jgi:DNA-binding CsgD family transcriptional regulator
MTDRPRRPQGNVVLLPIPSQPASTPPPPPQEIVLDGRKYRLVPMDGAAGGGPGPGPDAGGSPPAGGGAGALGYRPPEVLTARELQIVALVAEGRPNKQIAAELGISEWTVSTHLRRIYAKLDVDTRAAMVTRCYAGLVARGVPSGDG